MTTDPHSGRATEHYANAAYCRLAGGASVEAHLERVAAHALPGARAARAAAAMEELDAG